MADKTIYTVSPTGGEGEFLLIQSAIDQALLDGHDNVDSPAIIELAPGVYTESFSLPRAITIRGFSQPTFIQETTEPVIIDGTVTVDLALDGTINRTVAQMSGVQIRPSSGSGIIFTGTDPSILNLDTVTVESVDAVAVLSENTGAGSSLQSNQCVFRSLPGNASPAVEVTSALVLVLFGFVEQTDPADVAVHVDGGGFVFVFGRLFGTFDVDSGDASLFNAFQEVGAAVAHADIAAGASLFVANSTWVGSAAPELVTGAGTLLLGPLAVTAALNFAGTLTVFPVGSLLAPSVQYKAGTPANWVGSPPLEQQEFNERVSELLVTLNGGAIP